MRARSTSCTGSTRAFPSLSYDGAARGRDDHRRDVRRPERLGFPPRRTQRDRLLARVDSLLATDADVAGRAAERFPGDYTIVPAGVDLALFQPAAKTTVHRHRDRRRRASVARAALRALRSLDGWEAIVLRTARLAARPSIPMRLRDRVHVRTAVTGAARADLLADAAIVVPAPDGRVASASRRPPPGARSPSLPASRRSPSSRPPLSSASVRTSVARERDATKRREAVADHGFGAVAERLESVYADARRRRRPSRRPESDPLADRDWIVVDLHMHTSHSHDCSIDPP